MQDNIAQTILTVMDLTSLNESDTETSITAFCQKAVTPFGHVAAVCVFPQFVKQVKAALNDSTVKIATVANFPRGNEAIDDVISSISQSIRDGAQEIDVVFPYERYLAGDVEFSIDFIKKCKAACGERILLKVILETGAFPDTQMIAAASRDMILAGADFLKTSTGKIAEGATPQAATAMLMAIKEMSAELNRKVGFKASGGVRTIEQASEYIDLAIKIKGPDWVTPHTFRLGASQLLDVVLQVLR